MAKPQYESERRPIASRDYSASIRLSKWVAARGVTPNAISIAGMLAGIASGIAFACTGIAASGWPCFLAGAALMQLRLLANMLDGMVAVRTNTASPVGELYNEVPDRISDSAIFVGAGYGMGSFPEFGLCAALAALFTAYIRAQGKVSGAHQEYCGPMAKPQRMALMTLAALYAGLAPTAWQFHIAILPGVSTVGLALTIITVGSVLTAVRRLLKIATALRKDQA